MSDEEPTIEHLLNRFHKELAETIYPFLVLVVLTRMRRATREEVRRAISELSYGKYEREVGSHEHLMGRLDKTFDLIQPIDEEKLSADTEYQVTAKGAELLALSKQEVIRPLMKFVI